MAMEEPTYARRLLVGVWVRWGGGTSCKRGRWVPSDWGWKGCGRRRRGGIQRVQMPPNAVPDSDLRSAAFCCSSGVDRVISTRSTPKPFAPLEVRGEFRAIDTNVSGIRVSELLPQTAARMDRLTVLRSLTHNDPAHLSSAHAAYTGHLAPNVVSDKDPPRERTTRRIWVRWWRGCGPRRADCPPS